MNGPIIVIDNVALDVPAVPPLTGSPVLDFHRRLPGYAESPLVDLPALAERLGVARVSLKDESTRFGLPAFKILGASWAIACEVDRRLGRTGARSLDELRVAIAAQESGPQALTTLVAATDGNHGRAVARMAHLLGLSSIILVPAGTVDARIDAIASESAQVIVTDGDYDEAVRRAATFESPSHAVIADTAWPGYHDVPTWVIEGYATIVAETLEQLAHRQVPIPTVVMVQVGVGAFAAAIVRSLVPLGLRVITVEPEDAACLAPSLAAAQLTNAVGGLGSIMAGLNCGAVSPVAWPALRAGVTTAVTISDDHCRASMRLLAATSVASGESGAAGLAGLLAHPGLVTSDDHVLLISTEGVTDPVAYAEIMAGIDEVIA